MTLFFEAFVNFLLFSFLSFNYLIYKCYKHAIMLIPISFRYVTVKGII